MAAEPDEQHSRLIEANRREYGEFYPALTFLSPHAAEAATDRRAALLAELAGRIELGCGGTKLDMRRLSPGCRICAAGEWSCLFINGRCNARCFYCPSRQDETGLPGTNTVTFRSPADYVAYLEQFGFRGMSLSGGEPLLTPGRSLGFLKAAKKHFGDKLHTWLYTNGTLVDRDLLLRLRDAGLDEIRFDIGAVNYSLEKAAQAVGLIPTVTVEIPAVPEKRELLRTKMAEMADRGIRHLNLHQLRLTPYSQPRFAKRPYNYLHGEKVTVLESELTALELICYGLDAGIDLPVNYCSFVFKHRHQKAAARRRGASLMGKSYESVTAAGYLRSMALGGEAEQLDSVAEHLRSLGRDNTRWAFLPAKRTLHFAPELVSHIDFTGCALIISYADTAILEKVSYRNPFKELKLPSGRKIVAERSPVAEFVLEGVEARAFLRDYLTPGVSPEGQSHTGLKSLHAYEYLAEGLQEYF